MNERPLFRQDQGSEALAISLAAWFQRYNKS